MNKKTLNIILITLGAIGVLVLLYFIFTKEKTYSWNESYMSKSDQPYGILFIRRLLEESRDGEFIVREKKSLSTVFADEKFKRETNYVFIGESLFLNDDDEKALMNFIAEGNSAFVAAKEMPDFLSDLYTTECGFLVIVNDYSAMTPTLNFYHKSLHDKFGFKYTYRLLDEDIEYNWRVFDPGLFCDSTRTLAPLGSIDESNVNFIRIKYGRGYLYLHSNPIVFTNFFLIQKQKMDYASAAFSHLGGKNTVWEEFGKVPLLGGGDDGLNSPLYYIMQQPSLKYAWWLIVATALLYVLFAAKRTQRIIPVLESKTNTSLEFVKMIAALHYENKDHFDMARKKMKYFLYFIRSRYGLHGQPFTEELMVKLSEKSKVPLDDVRAVFKFNKLVEEGSNGAIDETRLTNFYNVIENFYKKCK